MIEERRMIEEEIRMETDFSFEIEKNLCGDNVSVFFFRIYLISFHFFVILSRQILGVNSAVHLSLLRTLTLTLVAFLGLCKGTRRGASIDVRWTRPGSRVELAGSHCQGHCLTEFLTLYYHN